MNIEINLKNEDDALNNYNKNLISESLDNYLINCLEHKPLNSPLTITISGTNKESIKNIIKNYYEEKYLYLKKIDNLDNYFRFIFLIIGIIIIFLSEQFSNILSEIFLIAGWVIIWEVMYDILFNEIKRKRKSKIYKSLKNAQIIIKNQ